VCSQCHNAGNGEQDVFPVCCDPVHDHFLKRVVFLSGKTD
jgi:hypothetical protein